MSVRSGRAQLRTCLPHPHALRGAPLRPDPWIAAAHAPSKVLRKDRSGDKMSGAHEPFGPGSDRFVVAAGPNCFTGCTHGRDETFLLESLGVLEALTKRVRRGNSERRME